MTGFAHVIRHALAHETAWPRDLRQVIRGGTFDPPPWNVVLGPTAPRGGPAGLVLRGGRAEAAWGDTDRADMAFSVTKSYLALVAGVALGDGLLADPTRPVAELVDHPAFASPRNRAVTWLQLLQQTSEWEGTLWGIPDTVDRNRQLSPDEDGSRFGQPHELRSPGSWWDYNDVRVNALCLALTRLFRRPLGDVLGERLLAPMGAAEGWSWWGYDAGEAVVGGGHWGGGIVTSAAHDALLGRLVLERGAWRGRRLVPEAWIDRMLEPCPLNPLYGCLWWLNTGRRLYPAAPASSVFALGVGLNAIWVEPSLDLVVVARWIDEPAFPDLVRAVMAALEAEQAP